MWIFRHSSILVLTLLVTFAGVVSTAASEHRIELKINGAVAYGDLVEPEGGGREKGVLVITHGTLAHKDMEIIAALQAALAERGIASLAHSLTLGMDRREGMYDCANPHLHRHEDGAAEIGAWITWLKANGAGPISLLGHSRGGNQAAWFAAGPGKGVLNALVLLAPSMNARDSNPAADYKRRFNADLDAILSKAKALIAKGAGTALMDMPGFLYCTNAKASAESVVSYYGPEPRRDTPALLPRLDVRTLVIAAGEDTVVPNVVERVRPLADGKKIQLRVVEDASHLFNDFFIEDAADLVAEFLKTGA